MKAIKVIGLFAGIICGTLIILAVFTKNPEVKLYDETINRLMVSEGFSSEQEALVSIPHLAKVKGKMDKLSHLKFHVRSKTQCPVPTTSKAERQALESKMDQIRQLREELRRDLKQVSIPQGQVTP